MPISVNPQNFDPFGSFARGFLGMRQIRDASRGRDLEERRLRLSEDANARGKQLFDLQLEQALKQKDEATRLPAARASMIRAAQPAYASVADLPATTFFPSEEEGSGIAGLSDIRRLTTRARTLPDLVSRLGPEGAETTELVSRLSPGTMQLLQLASPEAVTAEERTRGKRDEAEQTLAAALKDIEGGHLIAGFTKANQAAILSGQRPAFKDLADIIQNTQDLEAAENDGEILGPLLAKAASGDEQAAKDLLAHVPKARSKGFKAFAPHLFTLATTVLGSKVSPRVAAGLTRFTELLTKTSDPIKAWSALTAEHPEAAVAIRQAKLLPDEYEQAIKLKASGAEAEEKERGRRRAIPEAERTLRDQLLQAELDAKQALTQARKAGGRPETLNDLTLSIRRLQDLDRGIQYDYATPKAQRDTDREGIKVLIRDLLSQVDALQKQKRGEGPAAQPAAPTTADPTALRTARDAIVRGLYPGRAWTDLTPEEKQAVASRLRGAE